MTKKIFILSFLAFVGLTVFASPRSAKQAQSIAEDFFSQRSGTGQQKRVAPKQNKTLKLSYTAAINTNAAPAYYVYNRGENAGWVMVSGDTDVPEVLAYSNEGTFDYDRLGENTKYMLSRYASQVERVQDGETLLYATNASYEPIGALLGNRAWGQKNAFNMFCPKKGNVRCVTGCVATAMAQVMAHHKYPAKGKGTQSYGWNGQTLRLNFAESTYDWNNMADYYYESHDYSADPKGRAVATLMRDCGYSVQMDYGTPQEGGSGAYSFVEPPAFINYFDYDKSIQTVIFGHRQLGNFYESEEFVDIIYEELLANRPVYMTAVATGEGGHAYVVDGIDANGYLRINWGWYGLANGYYLLTNMHPKQQGTGGSLTNSAFTEQITIQIGVKPNAGGNYPPRLMGASSNIAEIEESGWGSYSLTPITVKAKKGESIDVPYLIETIFSLQLDFESFQGSLGFNLLNKDKSIVKSVTDAETEAEIRDMAYGTAIFEELPMPTDVPIGAYTLIPTATRNNSTTFPILGSPSKLGVTVVYKSDSVFLFGKEDIFSKDYKPSSLNTTMTADNTAELSWAQTKSLNGASYIVFVWDDSEMKYYKTSSKTLTLPSVTYDKTCHWAVLPVNNDDLAFSPIVYGDDFVVKSPQADPTPDPTSDPSDEPSDNPSDEPSDNPSDDPVSDPIDGTTTAVDDAKDKGIEISVSENTITVTTASATSISLYEVEGQLLQHKRHTRHAAFSVAKGVYIVVTPEKKQKVIVK